MIAIRTPEIGKRFHPAHKNPRLLRMHRPQHKRDHQGHPNAGRLWLTSEGQHTWLVWPLTAQLRLLPANPYKGWSAAPMTGCNPSLSELPLLLLGSSRLRETIRRGVRKGALPATKKATKTTSSSTKTTSAKSKTTISVSTTTCKESAKTVRTTTKASTTPMRDREASASAVSAHRHTLLHLALPTWSRPLVGPGLGYLRSEVGGLNPPKSLHREAPL